MRRLEVDDEIGSGQFGAEQFVIAVVDGKFVVAEVEVGEELVLLEDVVGDDDSLRIVVGGEGKELLVAADEEGKLGLESGSGLAVIEGREERVLLRLLQQLAWSCWARKRERVLLPTRIGPSTAMYRDGSKKLAMVRWLGTALFDEGFRGSIARGVRWEQQGRWIEVRYGPVGEWVSELPVT